MNKKIKSLDIYDVSFLYMDIDKKLKYHKCPCLCDDTSECIFCKHLIRNNDHNILRCNYNYKDLHLDKSYILKLVRNYDGKIIYLKYQYEDSIIELKKNIKNEVVDDICSQFIKYNKPEKMILYNIYKKIFVYINLNVEKMIKKYHNIYGYIKQNENDEFSINSYKIFNYDKKIWLVKWFK
jgi:hypothetical protein